MTFSWVIWVNDTQGIHFFSNKEGNDILEALTKLPLLIKESLLETPNKYIGSVQLHQTYFQGCLQWGWHL